jgi:hypothetical protein
MKEELPMNRRINALLIAAALIAPLDLAALPAYAANIVGSTPSAGGYHSGDFDGDGFADLVIAAPDESVNGANRAGAVHVVYGGDQGVGVANGPGTQLLVQGDFPSSTSAAGSRFGAAVASGDFDGDDYSDLAIGAPTHDQNASLVDSGMVFVAYGSPDGLRPLTVHHESRFAQDSAGILDSGEAGDQFGYALAAGDFNDDWYCDLAVGVPFENVGSVADAGAVNVIYGSPIGLDDNSQLANQFWHQNSADVDGVAEANDHFGLALGVGNFGYEVNYRDAHELVVGVPDEDLAVGSANRANAGMVQVLIGTSDEGLQASTSSGFEEKSFNATWALDLTASGVSNARFGASIATGQFKCEGSEYYDDLAVGAPGFSASRGCVAVIYNGLYGDFDGVTAVRWSQGDFGTPDSPEDGDGCGHALAAGDFNDDGADDLAVGIPFEDFASAADVGAVQVLYGSQEGIVGPGNQFLTEESEGPFQGPEAGDKFGIALSTGRYGRQESGSESFGVDDLAIGVSGDRSRFFQPGFTRPRIGSVHVLYGVQFEGLGDEGRQLFTQDTSGMPETGESGDNFGGALR